MGANNIEVMKIGMYKSANEAYRDACSEADDEYGHQQGYSGEINSTNSIAKSNGHPRYGSKVFRKWQDKSLDDMENGELLYIELTKSQLKKYQPAHLIGERGVKGYVFFGWARS